MKKKPVIYAYIHLPKTGGTTIRNNIAKNLKDEEKLLFEFPPLDKLDSYREMKREQLSKMTEEEKKPIRIIYGHDIHYGLHEFFPNHDFRYAIFVRDPVKRTISSYNYRRDKLDTEEGKTLKENGKILSFESWLKKATKYDNNMMKYLIDLNFINKKLEDITDEDIADIVSKFYFIGLVGQFKRDTDFFYGIFNFKRFTFKENVSKKYFSDKPSEELITLIKKKNEVDMRLFKQCVKHNKEFIKNNPKLFKKMSRRTKYHAWIFRIKRKIYLFLHPEERKKK